MKTLKGLGAVALGICGLAALALVVIMIVSGIGYVSAKVLPWLFDASWLAFAFCLVLLLPLSFFRWTRRLAFYGLFFGSYVFGICAWTLGFLVTYSLWGFIGVAIGLFIFGIGVVPVAVLAAMIHGSWEVVWELLVLVALTFGVRIYAAYLAQKVDQEAYERSVLTMEVE